MTVAEPELTPVADPAAGATPRSYDELLVLVTEVLLEEKLSEDDIHRHLLPAHDVFLSATQAVQLGIADRIQT